MSHHKNIFWDFVERAGWSAGQQFIAVLLTSGTSGGLHLPWKIACSLALGAGLASLVTTALQYLTPLKSLPFWQDLLVRLVKTFLASLLASFGVGALDILTFHWAAALNLAAVATIQALAKGLLARGVDHDSPATLAPAAEQNPKPAPRTVVQAA